MAEVSDELVSGGGEAWLDTVASRGSDEAHAPGHQHLPLPEAGSARKRGSKIRLLLPRRASHQPRLG